MVSNHIYKYAVVSHLDLTGYLENKRVSYILHGCASDVVKRERVVSCHTSKELAKQSLHNETISNGNPHLSYTIERLKIK